MKTNYVPLLPYSLPQDIYLGIEHLPRPTGFEPFDRFARLIHQKMHGIGVGGIAANLGIRPSDLNGMIRALSGLTAIEWQEEYLLLAVNELLPQDRIPMHTVASRLGYSRNGLHRFLLRHHIPPRRCWYH